ncbi:MAG: helix-turn-helix domain-containing protein [Myxococcota bacterium]
MSLRARQRAAQRDKLQQAAWDLFEAQGYAATTVEAIAAAAGTSVPTLFRYFPSKADLVVGDADAAVARVVGAIREPLPGEPLLGSLRRAVVAGTVAATGDRVGRLRAPDRHVGELHRQLEIDDRAIRATAAAIADRAGLPPGDPRPRARCRGARGRAHHALEAWRDDPRGRTLAEAIEPFALLPRRGACSAPEGPARARGRARWPRRRRTVAAAAGCQDGLVPAGVGGVGGVGREASGTPSSQAPP